MAQPFGLTAGSTPSSRYATYLVSFEHVPTPHPDFVSYMGSWSPELGLTRVLATTKVFANDFSGRSAIRIFDKIATQLERIYGVPEDLRELVEESIWQEDDEFAESIAAGDRSHSVVWKGANSESLAQGLHSIFLTILAEAPESLKVTISYILVNVDDSPTEEELGYGMDSL